MFIECLYKLDVNDDFGMLKIDVFEVVLVGGFFFDLFFYFVGVFDYGNGFVDVKFWLVWGCEVYKRFVSFIFLIFVNILLGGFENC